MNPVSYHLAVSMAACRVTDAVTYTMGTMIGLSLIKNCYTMLVTGIPPVVSVFCYSL